MLDAPLSFALLAGIVAAFNPCGFALLPVYLSMFLTTPDDDHGAGPLRALGVAAAVTAGFVAVFGVAGLVLTRLSLAVQEYLPWLTLLIGLALVPLGVAVVRGFSPSLPLRPRRGPTGRGPMAMAGFGVSYALVSLSCTLPVFLAATSGTLVRSGFVSGLALFAVYALGMGLVLTTLTLAVALARDGLVGRIRRVLPFVHRASGVLLVAAGAYVAYYGVYSVRVNSGGTPPSGPVALVTEASNRIAQWASSAGAVPIGLVLAAIVLVAATAGVARERRRGASVATPLEAQRSHHRT
jgi:cytochrome c biogenesis protein CcdA